MIFLYHLSQVLWSKSKISLTDDLVDMVKDIFFTELLAAEKRGPRIDDNLADEFDNLKERRIDLVNGRMNFNED